MAIQKKIRKMVKIDEDLCTGCGECVPSCAEGAIQIIDGKAKLLADNLCDGLGACLGDCPEGAITIEEREADEYDEAAVHEHLAKVDKLEEPPDVPAPIACSSVAGSPHSHAPGGGCPGARMMQFDGPKAEAKEGDSGAGSTGDQPTELRQWPIQLHLVPPSAPYYQNADLLLAADCTAFSVGNFHHDHLKGKAIAIACPKLDQGQEIYLQKLKAMIDEAHINTLTVMVMEVPCCAGLVRLAQEAANVAQRKVPVKKLVVGVRGEILAEEWL
ncbi:MAG: 4Fe-4S binding protein [bacterium]